MKFFRYAKVLARYWRMTQDPRTPPAVRVLIYAAIIYTISPIDLLPDWVPGLGLLDDAAIVPGIITIAMALVPKEVKRDHDIAEKQEIKENRVEGKVQAIEAEHEDAKNDAESAVKAATKSVA